MGRSEHEHAESKQGQRWAAAHAILDRYRLMGLAGKVTVTIGPGGALIAVSENIDSRKDVELRDRLELLDT